MALYGVGETMRIHPKDKYKREAQFYGDMGPECTLLLDSFETLGGDLKDKRALEMFVGDGSFRSVDIIVRVGEFEGWDIDPIKLKKLREQFPWVKCELGEAQELAQRAVAQDPHRRLYDLISLDAPARHYGDKYCEHFEVLGLATKLLKPKGALMLNLMQMAMMGGKAKHRKRRDEFYMQSAEGISLEDLLDFYEEYFYLLRKEVIHTKVEPHGFIGGYNLVLFMLEDV